MQSTLWRLAQKKVRTSTPHVTKINQLLWALGSALPILLPKPLHIPSRTGSLSHSLAKKAGDVDVEPDVFGTTTEPFLSDSYTVFDLYGSFRLNERLRFNLGVYNLFDEAYYQWARIRNVNRGDF